ncbi:hypothetical protein LZ023_36770 (plasmid) [Pseudomonas silvicola]|nr:hypothetical protein LZ023_36770 [Pseudomonas silvicola]
MDYSKAKALLADAGYPNGLDLTLIASDKPATRTQLGIALREMANGAVSAMLTIPNSAQHLDQVWKKGNPTSTSASHGSTTDAGCGVLAALHLDRIGTKHAGTTPILIVRSMPPVKPTMMRSAPRCTVKHNS